MKAPSTGPAPAISVDRFAVDEQRRRVAGDRDPHRFQRVLGDRQGGDAAEGRVAAREQGPVEGREGDQRVAGQRRRGAQRVAGLGGHRGGARAAPGDVADHEHPAAGRREGVVEVAADLVLGPRGPVGGGHRPARDVGQRRRQQAALERVGDLRPRLFGALEVGEEPGVLEGQRDPAGEDAGELDVLAAVAPSRPGDAEGQRSGQLAPGPAARR